MTYQCWTQLSILTKQVWYKINGHDWAIILCYYSGARSQGQEPRGPKLTQGKYLYTPITTIATSCTLNSNKGQFQN